VPGRIPELARFVPPARALDKYVYSPPTSVIVVTDAVCSSADETYDATMALYTNRLERRLKPYRRARVTYRVTIRDRKPVPRDQ
jgi:hypothetical protein